jgi:DNA-binding response OmpR family regulator
MFGAAQIGERKTMARQPTILLVEDEPRLQTILARTLEQSGYRVETASTAGEAVSVALSVRPDVLVLDVNLPDDTGWGVLRRLMESGVTTDTLPTIVLSAGQPAHSRINEFRPNAFLAKPFPIHALKRLIAEALGEANPDKRSISS